MGIRRLIAAVALVLAAVTSAGAAERMLEPVPGAALQCSLSGNRFPPSSRSTTTKTPATRPSASFIGAEVFVPAQPGLTAEWLDRVFTSEIAVGACNFGVAKVDVEVLSDGGGFSVRISGNSEKRRRDPAPRPADGEVGACSPPRATVNAS